MIYCPSEKVPWLVGGQFSLKEHINVTLYTVDIAFIPCIPVAQPIMLKQLLY